MKKIAFITLSAILALPLPAHAGIKKNEGAVNKAQTSPISLKQKLEETKDGVKGAPAPSMTFYPNAKFLTTSPVETKKAGEDSAEIDGLAEQFQPEEGLEKELGFEEENAEKDEAAASQEGEEDGWWSEDDEQALPAE